MTYRYSSCGDIGCCDECQNCNNCDDTCDTKQNFCTISSQNAAKACGFSNPWGEIKPGDIIIDTLPRSKYNKILDCIEKAYNKGSKQDSGLTLTVTGETGDFITAKKTNEIIKAINALNGTVISSNDVPTLAKDTHIVYAKYFNAISKGLMNMKLKSTQCDNCNIECDVTCDNCDGCITCDYCDTCLTCNSCNSVSSWSCGQWSCAQWADSSGNTTS